MMNLTASLASYVVSALWQVPLLYLAGCLMARIIRRNGPAAEHRVWVAVLLLCVVVPALPAPGMHGQSVAVAITDVHVHSSTLQTSGPARGWNIPLWMPLPVMQGIVIFWLLTVIYGMTRLLVGVQRTRRMVNAATPYSLQAAEQQLWHRCVTSYSLTRTRVLETDAIQSPVTVSRSGCHILLLPTQFFTAVPDQEQQAALAHECAHMQRGDYRRNILLQLAAVAIFFHPFTLLVRRQLSSSREMACDAAASAQLGSAVAYRSALVHLAMWIAHGNPAPRTAAIGIFDSHSLEDRLNRLEKEMLNTRKPVRYALATVAFLGVTVTASALALNGMRLLPTASKSADPVAIPAPSPAPVETPLPSSTAQPKSKLTKPVLIHQVDPEYPQSARSRGDLGDHVCLVKLTVDMQGMPQNVHIARSGGADFDENALVSVRQYRFKPAMQAGEAVAADISIVVDFRIF
ncbi:M56 family metallopeptidase [Terriglobus sp. TAA 43]|uniref:M56 family metallopeptidase n=1 Tax=Terriglobus sp. TAA 43 TaxID=278961 RepID=UPI000647BAE5|nr:M56 family metallopeptidase [Terriglobus sp. TAA 43]